MNTRRLITTVAAAAALIGASGSVLAQEATADNWLLATGTHSRAEVVSALDTARQTGELAVFQRGYLPPLVVSVPRAEVRAETSQAIANGQVAALADQAYRFGTDAARRVAGSPTVRAAR